MISRWLGPRGARRAKKIGLPEWSQRRRWEDTSRDDGARQAEAAAAVRPVLPRNSRVVGATGFEPATPCAQGSRRGDSEALKRQQIARFSKSCNHFCDHLARD